MKALVLAAPCLNVGYLGCYGCSWVCTPHLDRLAAEGSVFDQHYADCPVSAAQFRAPAGPAPSWWTGRYWFPDCEGQDDAPHADAGQLLPLLEANGIRTVYINACRCRGGTDSPLSPEFPVPALVEALERLAGNDRWLVWADLTSLAPPWSIPAEFLAGYFPQDAEDEAEPPHAMLDPPCGPVDPDEGESLERLHNTYAAALSYWDAQLGIVLQELRCRDLYDNTLLVVTADLGLALGEHGLVGPHRPWLHDELIHLPLVVRLPGGAEAGRRIAALTQPVDLFPTIVDAIGLPLHEVHGRTLLRLARGEADRIRDYACAGLALGGALEYALRTPEWSFLLPVQVPPGDAPRRPQLYVKPDDRWEVNNVVQHHLELAERLEQTLRDIMGATRQPGPLAPSTKR
jgi:arylsulfatase A-like enzyme